MVSCYPSFPKYPLQQQCVAEDLTAWQLTTNNLVSTNFLENTCNKNDEIAIDGQLNGMATLTKDIQISKSTTIALTSNFSGNCNAQISLGVDSTWQTFPLKDKIQGVRVSVQPGMHKATVYIYLQEVCKLSLSVLTELDPPV